MFGGLYTYIYIYIYIEHNGKENGNYHSTLGMVVWEGLLPTVETRKEKNMAMTWKLGLKAKGEGNLGQSCLQQ